MSARSEVAIVVQRYGTGVTGGSESLARALAERLAAFYRVSVLTTCARDYVTWRNELAAGEGEEGGVRVRRFRVEEERDLVAFNAFAETLYDRPHSREDEFDFLRRQGPCVPSLVEALRAERERFAAVFFFTYLYYPTYFGLEAAPEHAILVPTTHDEPPLRFSIYRDVFARPRAFAFLTAPEEALVRSRFPIGERPSVVAGMGVDVPPAVDVRALQGRHRIHRPFALYAGRIDAGKGCDEMLAHYARYRRIRPDGVDLLLIGRLAMPEPRASGVRCLGYLPEDEKAAAMAGACAVVCPSPYESLSIALLEGFALGTPGLASARSAVLKDHCLRSNAGLVYEDADEFAEALDVLARRPRLRAALGDNGRRYVADAYRWDVVLGRYRTLVEAVA